MNEKKIYVAPATRTVELQEKCAFCAGSDTSSITRPNSNTVNVSLNGGNTPTQDAATAHSKVHSFDAWSDDDLSSCSSGIWNR